jgi:hypothetical protein
MKRIVLAAAMLLAACGGDDSTGPSGAANVAGNWVWQANVSNASFQLSCVATGSLVLQQSGAQFSGQLTNGQGTCTGPGGSAPFDPNGSLTSGTISGSTLSYSDGICTYSGQMSGSPVNQVQGNVNCTFAIEGQNIPMTGTWHVGR